MTDSQQRMLDGFAEYSEPVSASGKDHNTIFLPLGTRLLRIVRLPQGWRLWTSTINFKFGTFLELFNDGRILNCTVREDEGDDIFWARPSDEYIRDLIRGEAARRSGTSDTGTNVRSSVAHNNKKDSDQ